MNKVFNGKQTKAFRRQLRNNMPEPERRLWARIRSKQLGVKFRRQHGIGRYIADFYCPEIKLIIELDGDSHFSENAANKDAERTAFMNLLGIQVLRFTNLQVMTEPEAVVQEIMKAINPNPQISLL